MRSSPCCRRPSARGAIRSSWRAPGSTRGSLPSSTSIRRRRRCPMRWCRDATPKGCARCSSIWTLGFALSLPIFDAGRREAALEQAEARRRQALASYQGSIESAFREVSDALVNLEQTGASEADLLERLQAARNALQLSSERYEAGYSPYLEVLDAQRTANEAELAFVRNRQARLAFSVDLMKALGGGWRAQ